MQNLPLGSTSKNMNALGDRVIPVNYSASCFDKFNDSPHKVDGFYSISVLIEALKQIQFYLKAEIDDELRKHQLLLSMNQSVNLKCEENLQPQIIQENVIMDDGQQKSNQEKRNSINDTKNIPKNFGKAIIAFINRNPKVSKKCLLRHQIDFSTFTKQLKNRKKNLHSIKELRSLWLQQQFTFAKAFRQLSSYFLTRGSFKYIFGSRVVDYTGHLKYRRRIIEALQLPTDFNSIKK